MNKKFLSGILCGALLIASASAFVSCKDYDDDISSLQKQIDDNKGNVDQKYADLTKVVEDNMKSAQSQINALNEQIKAAEAANKDAHDALAALIEAEATARVAADDAAKAYADAQAAAAKDYTDAAKAEALAAAKAASDAAQKFADEAAAALATAEANAAATYATKVELEAARAALQAGIDAAQADATDALAKCAQLKSDLADLEAKLTLAYKEADEDLKAQLQDEITAVKDALSQAVSDLTKADAELEKKIEAANKLIAEAQDNIKALQADVADLQSAVKELNEVTIPAVKKEIADTKKALEESIADLDKKHGEDVAALKASLTELEKALALTNKAVEALTARVKALEDATTALKNRVADMESAIVAVKNDLAAHVVLFNAFKAETEDNFLAVWDSVAGLDARCVDIEAKAAALEASLNETKAALAALAEKEGKDVEALYKKIADEKEAIIKKMGEDIAAAKAELTQAFQAADAILKQGYEAADAQIRIDLGKEINDRIQAVADEAQAREAADKAEKEARILGDNNINIRIDGVISAYKAADAQLQEQIDVLKYDLNQFKQRVGQKFDEIDGKLYDLNTRLSKVENDLKNLITQIVYQGSAATGSYVCDPIVKGDEPLIYYANQDAAREAWPSATVKNHAPALAKNADVFQYQKGHFYATVNPAKTDFSGITLDLENSEFAASKYFKFGALEVANVLITKAPVNGGLYKMELLPTEGFDYDAVKADKVLYAMAANYKDSENKPVKVSATYGLDNFENYCEVYPSAKPGKHALPEFKFYTDDTYTTVQGKNALFSNYEYAVATTTEFPTAYLKLDNEIAQWNYKWYVEFFEYTDNAYTPGTPDLSEKGDSIDPTTIFADYEDEALDSITFTKSFTLKDADYINKRILVKVSAINYNYEEQVAYTILSFTRPLFEPVTLVNQFYPGHKTSMNLYFTQQLKDSLGADGVEKYNKYADANGADVKAITLAGGVFGPAPAKWTLDEFDNFTYEPTFINYSATSLEDNICIVPVVDKADHKIIVVTLNPQIKTPYHLDYQVIGADGLAANRIPASFGFSHEGPDGQTIKLFENNEDMVLVWADAASLTYNLKGAYVKLTNVVPGAGTPLGATPWFDGDWMESNGSVFTFDALNTTEIAVDQTLTSPLNYAVKAADDTKVLTTFASDKVKVAATGKNADTKTEVIYDLVRRISYYNCGLADRYFSAAADTFQMAFVSPINYGLYRAATDVKDGETFTVEYSLVKGANTIKFDNVFPDYSKITSGIPYTFTLKDTRIDPATNAVNVVVTGTEIPEYSYLESFTFDQANRQITFNYTNTAAISTFSLPCELSVKDVWGVTTTIKFNLKFLPNKL